MAIVPPPRSTPFSLNEKSVLGQGVSLGNAKYDEQSFFPYQTRTNNWDDGKVMTPAFSFNATRAHLSPADYMRSARSRIRWDHVSESDPWSVTRARRYAKRQLRPMRWVAGTCTYRVPPSARCWSRDVMSWMSPKKKKN